MQAEEWVKYGEMWGIEKWPLQCQTMEARVTNVGVNAELNQEWV